MIQEEKQLLLKDLCARLSYGVEVFYSTTVPFATLITINAETANCIVYDHSQWYKHSKFNIETIKPYLRPMSSMMEEEKIELCTIAYAPDEMKTIEEKLYVIKINAKYAADFYNEHHFDYRGLIEKGLALEAPEGMYKTK